jgi:hypothetical protein
MKTEIKSLALVALSVALCAVVTPVAAQSPREQAEKELTREVPEGSVPACSLITRTDVEQATGRDPYVDPESSGQGGWICNVGIGELKVYSSPNSWESTLKSFNKDEDPNTPASGFGERAYFFYPQPDNEYQGHVAFLVVNSGNHTLALSLDAPEGEPAESMRPALESLMKTILGRLP